MAVFTFVRGTHSGKRPVSINYYNLDSFKEGVIDSQMIEYH